MLQLHTVALKDFVPDFYLKICAEDGLDPNNEPEPKPKPKLS
jgi:hypothetical protein